MKRNTALDLSAWLIVLIVANATRIGDILQREAASAVAAFRVGLLSNGRDPAAEAFMGAILTNDPDTKAIAWWIVFGVLTLLAIVMGKMFVALWGEKQQEKIAGRVGQAAALDQDEARRLRLLRDLAARQRAETSTSTS